jgi:hypothetical protein
LIYYDIIININSRYPIGIPKIIVPEITTVNWASPEDIPYRGLLKVRIIPPRNLLIPVIPIRCDQRMLFCLCFRCATSFKKKNTKIDFKCTHTDEERAFTSTITSIELSEALKQKYVVTHFYRAWEYTQFSDNIFKEYVRYVKQFLYNFF